ncbi:type II toxin-antitoxin system PemK/MazF family toxin [Anatilimnocola sp. NA78]|uniref:type II toxin-antitoxin system PemK/MazF family toxin n=1 Tax=Anatilimnocola sp. NA78 TaxID=3415683 RepID=UPI003CE53E8A
MKRGDVVLVQVPFVGTVGTKLRPALIVQADSLSGMLRETIIVAITSNLANVYQPHQLLIEIATADGAASGLLTNSAVRCERLHTIPQVDVKRTIGQLSSSLMAKVDECLKSALAIR